MYKSKILQFEQFNTFIFNERQNILQQQDKIRLGRTKSVSYQVQTFPSDLINTKLTSHFLEEQKQINRNISKSKFSLERYKMFKAGLSEDRNSNTYLKMQVNSLQLQCDKLQQENTELQNDKYSLEQLSSQQSVLILQLQEQLHQNQTQLSEKFEQEQIQSREEFIIITQHNILLRSKLSNYNFKIRQISDLMEELQQIKADLLDIKDSIKKSNRFDLDITFCDLSVSNMSKQLIHQQSVLHMMNTSTNFQNSPFNIQQMNNSSDLSLANFSNKSDCNFDLSPFVDKKL